METARETSVGGHVTSKGGPLPVGMIVLVQPMIPYRNLRGRAQSGSISGFFGEGGVDWELSYPTARCACMRVGWWYSYWVLGTARDASHCTIINVE